MSMGCSRKNPHPPGNSLGRGSKTMEIQAGGGVKLEKVSAGVISTDSSHDLNIKIGDTSALSDPENS